MNANQFAAGTVMAIAAAAYMPAVLAQHEQHEGNRPEISAGFVRAVYRRVSQSFRASAVRHGPSSPSSRMSQTTAKPARCKRSSSMALDHRTTR